jgi:hypothetical protein
MDNHPNPQSATGFAYSVLSIMAAVFARVTLDDAKAWTSFFASLIALASGVMAVRYYYYATKKVKQ